MLRVVVAPTSEEDGGWIDVVAPTADEIARLREEHGITEELVAHSLDPDERPRVEVEGEVTLVVLQVSHATGEAQPEPAYVTLPFGILLAGRWLVTISPEETQVLGRIREFAAVDWSPRRRPRFVLHTLEVVARTYLADLAAINRQVDVVEARLATSLANREVLELLRYQKSFIHLGTALRSSERLLQQLQRRPAFHIPEEDAELLEDVMVEIQQAVEVATTSGNILGEMMDAFASIISNNLNVVMKFLAAVAVMLSLPVILASYFGMNVQLPLQGSRYAFVLLVGISLLPAAVLGLWFRKQRWL